MTFVFAHCSSNLSPESFFSITESFCLLNKAPKCMKLLFRDFNNPEISWFSYSNPSRFSPSLSAVRLGGWAQHVISHRV